MAIIGEFGAAKRELTKRDDPDYIIFYGEQFQIADEVGGMVMFDFADVAARGIDSNEMEGLAAMRALIKDCLADGEWQRFHDATIRHKVPPDVLMAVATKVYEVISSRPTESPSGSAGGRSNTSPSSSTSASRRESLGLVPVEQAMGLVG